MVLVCVHPRYFIEYFATDLLMTPDGECVGVIAVCMEVRQRERKREKGTARKTGVVVVVRKQASKAVGGKEGRRVG